MRLLVYEREYRRDHLSFTDSDALEQYLATMTLPTEDIVRLKLLKNATFARGTEGELRLKLIAPVF